MSALGTEAILIGDVGDGVENTVRAGVRVGALHDLAEKKRLTKYTEDSEKCLKVGNESFRKLSLAPETGQRLKVYLSFQLRAGILEVTSFISANAVARLVAMKELEERYIVKKHKFILLYRASIIYIICFNHL